MSITFICKSIKHQKEATNRHSIEVRHFTFIYNLFLLNYIHSLIRFSSRSIKPIMSSRVLNKRDDDQLEYIFELAYQEILQATKTTPLKQSKTGNLTEVDDWLKNVIEYNLKNGKRNRAKFLVIAYELFINKPVSDSDIQKACILGWCVEFLQTYFLILDDIMDNSVTRRGQLCWYRKVS